MTYFDKKDKLSLLITDQNEFQHHPQAAERHVR